MTATPSFLSEPISQSARLPASLAPSLPDACSARSGRMPRNHPHSTPFPKFCCTHTHALTQQSPHPIPITHTLPTKDLTQKKRRLMTKNKERSKNRMGKTERNTEEVESMTARPLTSSYLFQTSTNFPNTI